MEEIPNQEWKTLPCKHTFHQDCIVRWRDSGKVTCPVCRAEFEPQLYTVSITIQPTGIRTSRVTSNIARIADMFSLDVDASGMYITSIAMSILGLSDVQGLINELGFPNLV
jgi:hypothetical protein